MELHKIAHLRASCRTMQSHLRLMRSAVHALSVDAAMSMDRVMRVFQASRSESSSQLVLSLQHKLARQEEGTRKLVEDHKGARVELECKLESVVQEKASASILLRFSAESVRLRADTARTNLEALRGDVARILAGVEEELSGTAIAVATACAAAVRGHKDAARTNAKNEAALRAERLSAASLRRDAAASAFTTSSLQATVRAMEVAAVAAESKRVELEGQRDELRGELERTNAERRAERAGAARTAREAAVTAETLHDRVAAQDAALAVQEEALEAHRATASTNMAGMQACLKALGAAPVMRATRRVVRAHRSECRGGAERGQKHAREAAAQRELQDLDARCDRFVKYVARG